MEKQLNTYKYMGPPTPGQGSLPPLLQSLGEGTHERAAVQREAVDVSSRCALPRRRGHLLGVRVLAKGVLLDHSGDLFNTPDLVSAVGNPGPEGTEGLAHSPHPHPARPQKEEELLKALRPCVTCFVCPGYPVSTLCLNYLSFL